MSYISPRDRSQDPSIVQKVVEVMLGDLDLSWMESIRERVAFRPSDPRRGLTLDDINGASYGPDSIPEIVRNNFSMAPRGSILVPGLPSLGYRVNRKSDVWADNAPALFEEAKSRRWAPAKDVPWSALDGRDPEDRRERAVRQLATDLIAIGLVTSDVPAYWVWRMNQEFHEIKYLLCVQMFDASRLAEACRKRALYGSGSLGVDCKPLAELLKMVFDCDTYPEASLSQNLVLFPWVQSLLRHLEYTSDNEADTLLGTRLAQDAGRFIAYGSAHIRQLIAKRPAEAEVLNESLDLLENGLVGALGAAELIEPLIVLAGGLGPVERLYARTLNDYLARLKSAGLGDRRERSPLPDFVAMLRD